MTFSLTDNCENIFIDYADCDWNITLGTNWHMFPIESKARNLPKWQYVWVISTCRYILLRLNTDVFRILYMSCLNTNPVVQVMHRDLKMVNRVKKWNWRILPSLHCIDNVIKFQFKMRIITIMIRRTNLHEP